MAFFVNISLPWLKSIYVLLQHGMFIEQINLCFLLCIQLLNWNDAAYFWLGIKLKSETNFSTSAQKITFGAIFYSVAFVQQTPIILSQDFLKKSKYFLGTA